MAEVRSYPKHLLIALGMLWGLLQGCLPEPVAIEGQQLFQGRGIENISSLEVQGRTFLFFETRQSLPTPERGGSTDMWIVPLDGLAPAFKFFSGRTDAWPAINAGGDPPQYWVAVNERQVVVGRRDVRIADRVRVDVTGQVLEQVREVSQFSLLGDGWKTFQRPLPDGSAMAHHIRDADGNERRLDDVTGPIQFHDAGFFYVGGPALTLYWVPDLLAPAEPLRSGVTRMRLRPRDNYGILTVPLNGRPADVVFDLFRRTERQIPGSNICCWLDFAPEDNDVWRYAEARTAEAPARYHEYHVRTGADVVKDLPAIMADLIRIERRPGSDNKLYFDSQNTLALQDATAAEPIKILPLKVPSPRFSNDGRYFLYVRPETLVPWPEGPLMIQDVAFSAPERQLSPPGTALLLNSFFTIENPMPPIAVFWARFGRAASDLYFAPLDEPGLQRVANGIRNVDVTRSRLIGIVRTSLQDLVGDLVIKTLPEEQEVILGKSVDNYRLVDDAQTSVTKVVYSLRTRKSADVEGIWVTELPAL